MSRGWKSILTHIRKTIETAVNGETPQFEALSSLHSFSPKIYYVKSDRFRFCKAKLSVF